MPTYNTTKELKSHPHDVPEDWKRKSEYFTIAGKSQERAENH